MNHLLIQSDSSIKEALKQLNKSGEKCLIVVDSNNNYLGTISDGDVRRSILKGKNFDASIKSVFNKDSTYVEKGKFTIKKVKSIFLENKFDLIPVLDESNKVVEILFWDKVFKNTTKEYNQTLSVPVVIMAGGKGARLEPFTKVLPKPLIPIHEKPVIEHIIERFTAIGISDFYITVNYKSRIMKAFFEELDPEYSVTFFTEEKPLGTAGSLRYLIDNFESPFFVTNCDTIINADLASFYQYHNSGKYAITIAASAKEYVIPFGACKLNKNGSLDSINEKPSFDFLINTGLYIINPEVLNLIPKEKVFHTTDLIKAANKNNMEIGVYPIDEDSWIDVGQWAEYQKAVEKL